MTVKEYGASSYLRAIAADIEKSLKRHYPQGYKELFVFSALRLLEQTPLKRFGLSQKSTPIEGWGGKTQLAEIPKKTRKVLEKLEYVLPEEPITKKG